MEDARRLMDRVSNATIAKDLKTVAECYATDAVAVTPDQGEITGRDQIVEYMRQFVDAFPDLRFEYLHKHDCGNVAVDEGYVGGTHTAPLPLPSGENIPPTGMQIRVRSCDIATVEDGLITEHRFYFDQMEFLGQLGLLPDLPS